MRQAGKRLYWFPAWRFETALRFFVLALPFLCHQTGHLPDALFLRL
jgi:hypothetical protein